MIILFFLPWLDRSPVRSIRYRPGWHKYLYGLFVIFFLALGYLGSQPPSAGGNYVSQVGTLVYLGFFLLMEGFLRAYAQEHGDDYQYEKHARALRTLLGVSR